MPERQRYSSGGMLIAIAEDKAEALISTLRKYYPHASLIGRVLPCGPNAIVVKSQSL